MNELRYRSLNQRPSSKYMSLAGSHGVLTEWMADAKTLHVKHLVVWVCSTIVLFWGLDLDSRSVNEPTNCNLSSAIFKIIPSRHVTFSYM